MDWFAEGEAHYSARRWRDAASAFEHALAAEPDRVDAWYKLGNAYEEQGDDARALECFNRVVALDPAHARAWNNIGVTRQKRGEEALAEEAYRLAVEKDPSLLSAVLNLAYLRLAAGNFDAAARALERAASLDPDNADTWQALVRARLSLGDEAAANDAYRTAMKLLSPRLTPLLREAELAFAAGDYVAARKGLSSVQELIPDHPSVRHMLAALQGQTLERASREHIALAFDFFAQDFDDDLRGIGYRAPERLVEAVRPLLPKAARVLDLGCGTGQLGAALAPLQARVVGVDLSQKMLERARQRGMYERLVEGDLVEELEHVAAGTFDAVLATDVFVYLGNLQPVFAAAARALVPRGIFAFTTEILDGGDFELRPTGRFAHSSGYIRSLAAACRFSEHCLTRIHGRRQRDTQTDFWLACFLSAG